MPHLLSNYTVSPVPCYHPLCLFLVFLLPLLPFVCLVYEWRKKGTTVIRDRLHLHKITSLTHLTRLGSMIVFISTRLPHSLILHALLYTSPSPHLPYISPLPNHTSSPRTTHHTHSCRANANAHGLHPLTYTAC